MSHYFVAMEAWDGDSDYDVFESLEDAAEAFRGFRDGDEWRGVWRDLWLIEHPVTEADFERYERESDGDLWSLWDVWDDAETVTVKRWTAPTVEGVEV